MTRTYVVRVKRSPEKRRSRRPSTLRVTLFRVFLASFEDSRKILLGTALDGKPHLGGVNATPTLPKRSSVIRRSGFNIAVFAALGVFTFAVAACESGGLAPSPDGQPAPAPTLTTPHTNDPPPPPAPAPTCKPPTAGPTIHKGGDVAANEVWTADGSPHIVERTVNIRNNATLTIEPCAEVRVAKGQYIHVAFPITPNTGTLIAEGTEHQPIKIVADKEGEAWASLSIRAPGTASLKYVTFEGGGGGDFQDNTTIAAYGDLEDGADPILAVDHVTIQKSIGAGVFMVNGAVFKQGSRDLTIRQSGSQAVPYPIEIEEHGLDTLPTGDYTGNRKDEIQVNPAGGRTAGSGLLADGTVHDRGVPYRVGTSVGDSLKIGGRTDGRLVTLTIEAGVVMKFHRGSALKVQHFTNQEPSTAALRALGTAAKPIVLTSAEDAPQPGDWMGIWFGGVPGPTNQIDHVRVEYAGGDCGCVLNTCSAIAQHEGAIIFTAQPPSSFITNTELRSISGHGITQGFDGVFVDFRPTNNFDGVAGCAQTLPRNLTTSCPAPKPACDGQ